MTSIVVSGGPTGPVISAAQEDKELGRWKFIDSAGAEMILVCKTADDAWNILSRVCT